MQASAFGHFVFLLLALVTSACWGQTASLVPKVQFLDKEQSAAVLAGPTAQSYFNAMHGAELAAKTRLDLASLPLPVARERARQQYANETLDFSKEEKEVLQWALDRLFPVLIAKTPLYARSEWKFAKVSASIEGGLPHTRSDTIVFSAPFLQTLIPPYKASDKSLATFLAYILVHEQTHVLQRADPTLFDELATNVLGFQHMTAPSDAWLLERRVVNPDAPVNEWVYPLPNTSNSAVLPYLLLSNIKNPRMPQDLQSIAVMATLDQGAWRVQVKDGIPVTMPLDDVKAYLAVFPNKSQLYHPYETSADLLGYWLAGHTHGDAGHPLRVALVAWAAKHLQ